MDVEPKKNNNEEDYVCTVCDTLINEQDRDEDDFQLCEHCVDIAAHTSCLTDKEGFNPRTDTYICENCGGQDAL